MKNTFQVSMLALVLLATAAFAPMAQAEVSTTTAATTTVTAATATSSASTTAVAAPSTKIADLMAQLAKLTELFNSLKAQIMGTKAEIKELSSEIRAGATSADIKTVQELLASDPTVYPRGLVTGYFGPMTKEAIMRFQKKNGLEVTGEINAETKAAMDTMIETKKTEGKYPAGLMLGEGLKQKFEQRLKTRCEAATASSTLAVPCDKIKAKYKFEVDDKGRVKMESKIKKDDDDDSHHSEDDDSDDSDEDDSKDDN